MQHHTHMHHRRHARGFSLVELVIVIVIIGVLAAIAIPRFSNAASNAGATALKGDLAVLRNAIEMYAAEHGGTYPTLANFEDQLTKYSSAAGTTANAYNASTAPFGPYLRAVPNMKIGDNQNNSLVLTANNPPVTADVTAAGGWLYHAASGGIWANNDEFKGF